MEGKELLLQRFKAYIAENKLIVDGDKILLGVSGGVDSTVMLDLFVRAGYTIGVAHCNFQLRGQESVEDEESVIERCRNYNIPVYNIRFDTYDEMERTKESVQIAARRLRYTWFESLCREHGYNRIAIAHNADDSIETFFINLIRGCGLKGLTGISVSNGHIIRPILFAHRREIVDYAFSHTIKYREDSSNSSTKYLRNKLRLGIVPKLREISPSFSPMMTANIGRLMECQAFIETQLHAIRERVCQQEGKRTVVDLDAIAPELSLPFVLRELLLPWGFNATVVESICQHYRNGDSGRKFFAPENIACLDRRKLIIEPIEEGDNCTLSIESFDQSLVFGCYEYRFSLLDRDEVTQFKQPRDIAVVDADRLHLPLTLRRWRNGDQFVPYGMSGSKKLSDYMIDIKLSLPDKDRQTVVENNDEIVWVCGQRIDDRYKITDTTRKILRIERSLAPVEE